MNDKEYKILFIPDQLEIKVKEGTLLLDAALDAGIYLNAHCRGTSSCGKCDVILKSGTVEVTKSSTFHNTEYNSDKKKACQSRVLSDLVIEIPHTARLENAVLNRETHKNTQSTISNHGWRYSPFIKKHYMEINPPSAMDNSSDLKRITRSLKSHKGITVDSVSISTIRKLSLIAREDDWKITATVTESGKTTLLDVEAGDTRNQNYAFAFDIGTTAVRGQLLNLNQGTVTTSATDYNKQISYGADVISRIAVSQRPGGLEKLQGAVFDTLNSLSRQMMTESGVGKESINGIIVAANTVMVHLLLGLSPEHLRLSPYVPTISSLSPIKAHEMGFECAESAMLYLVPSISSYVGGDIVSGIVGCGIHQEEPLTLYIDIGTNGEIVLGNKEWMLCAAASAGPTFEGGGIECGMLAAAGAIEDFSLNHNSKEPILSVIGDTKPLGICGSGIINTTACLLRNGLISPAGKFNTESNNRRIRQAGPEKEYVIAYAHESGTGKDIILSEVDLANLLRSKASLFAAYQTLLLGVNKGFSDIDRVVIAGTFGNSINIENAITIGLIPDIARDKISFAGNGALLGARLIAFSDEVRKQAEETASLITNVELSESKEFMEAYTAAMFLPHTNSSLFPSATQEQQK